MFVCSPGYVAGFVDPEVSNRSDLFDVYVNLPDSVITISQGAKGTVCSKRTYVDMSDNDSISLGLMLSVPPQRPWLWGSYTRRLATLLSSLQRTLRGRIVRSLR